MEYWQQREAFEDWPAEPHRVPPYWSAGRAAKHLGVTVDHVALLIEDGRLTDASAAVDGSLVLKRDVLEAELRDGMEVYNALMSGADYVCIHGQEHGCAEHECDCRCGAWEALYDQSRRNDELDDDLYDLFE